MFLDGSRRMRPSITYKSRAWRLLNAKRTRTNPQQRCYVKKRFAASVHTPHAKRNHKDSAIRGAEKGGEPDASRGLPIKSLEFAENHGPYPNPLQIGGMDILRGRYAFPVQLGNNPDHG